MLAFLLVVVGLMALGAGFEIAYEVKDERRYPPPGQRFEVPGGAKLHIHSKGDWNAPVVLFEAGISGSSLGWAKVQPRVAQFARAVVYDRAGLGWSSGSVPPRTVANMETELYALLKASDISTRFVLVGHSFGGLLAQVFAHDHPERVAAVVLVDPVTHIGWVKASENELRRLKMGARLARRGAWLARFGIVRFALWALMSGGAKISQAVAGATAGRGNATVSRLVGEVRKLPLETHPMIAANWCRPQSFVSLAKYLECLPEAARAALGKGVPAEIPLVILSAATAIAAEIEERDAWAAAHGNARHIRVPDSGHWLQLDQPDVVTDAIRTLLARVR